jgi:diaminohydroxyphosphoribosylaminopyrimidine deaminase/5-amino-6-(5-phosphoribosylamino)uracil reductase
MDRRRLAGMLRRWPARAPAVHIVTDLDFMRRALSLAATGVGLTGDNPSVGCVIVRDGAVIAEACTADGGRPHAEEQAVARADARGATAYVTLEPCAKRTNGTASCADRLIEAGVVRVVIAASDPHPFAAGVGVERLKAAGVSVETGLLASEAQQLNVDFHRRWTQA